VFQVVPARVAGSNEVRKITVSYTVLPNRNQERNILERCLSKT
jgi:hypothetical protein